MTRFRLLPLYLSTFAYWFSLYTYTSYLIPFLSSLGASAALAGLVSGSYGLAMMLCRIPIGIWADRIGKRRPFILGGCLLCAVSALGMALSKNAMLVLFFRLLSGIGVSTWVCFAVLFNSSYPPQQSDRALADANLLSSAGRLASGFAGAAAAGILGTRGSFLIGGVVGLIGFAFSFGVREAGGTREPLKLRSLLPVLREPALLFAGLICASFTLVTYAVGLSFVSTLAIGVGASDVQVGLLGSVNALGGMLGLFLTPRLFRKFLSEKALIIFATICSILGCFLFPEAKTVWQINLLQLAVGVTSGGLTSTLMAMGIRRIPEAKQASAMGAYQALYAIGILAGPPIMGLMVDQLGLPGAFRGITVFGLVCIAATLLFYDKTQQGIPMAMQPPGNIEREKETI